MTGAPTSWSVIAIAYPQDDGLTAKQRPALVVSSQAFHDRFNRVLCVPITTAQAMQDVQPGDIAVTDFEQVGLRKPCVIRPSRIASLPLAFVVTVKGSLKPKDRRAVSGALKAALVL